MKSAVLKWGLAIFVTILAAFSAVHIKVGENALDMLPAPSLQGDLQLFEDLGLINRLVISLEVVGDAPRAEIKKAVAALGASLEDNPQFSQVGYRLADGYQIGIMAGLWPGLPAIINADDLARIDALLSREGLKKVLSEDFILLNSLAGLPMKKQIQRDPLGFSRFILAKLSELRGAFAVDIDDGFFVSRDRRNFLLWAESRLPLTSSKQAEKIKVGLDRDLARLPAFLKPRIIGSLPHTLANARTVQDDLRRLLPVAMIVLLVIIVFLLRDIRALPVMLAPFMAAPVAVAGLGLFYGEVSAMALGFGIVLLGIGVDFSVHIYFAMGEDDYAQALRRLRKPMLMAALTTIGVFVVLLFSDVPSHRQMACLAIIGLIWAIFLAWTLVPSLGNNGGGASFISRLAAFRAPIKISPGWLIFIWLVTIIAGVLAWPHLHYNGDLRALDVGSAAIKADEEQFHAAWGKSGDELFMVASADNLSAALDKNDLAYDKLKALNRTGFQNVAPILPGPRRQAENIKAWQSFWQGRYDKLAADLENTAAATGFAPDAFLPFLDWLRRVPTPLDIPKLRNGHLKPMLASLVRRATGRRDGYHVVSIMADDGGGLTDLRSAVAGISGVRLLSNAGWREEVEQLLRRDIVRLSLAAGLLIILLVWIFFRRWRVCLAVLAPVLAALAAMAIFDYFTSRDLNLMHVLMGIMVIGLSVDYGIFIVCSVRDAATRSSVAAVTVCALSTLTGFGVLSLARHPALHALGATVLVGIGAAWPAAIFVSPALLFFWKKDK